MNPKSVILGIGAVGIALLAANTAKATTVADLTSGGTISAGDVTYSNFTYGGGLPASDVVVTKTATGLAFTTSTGGWSVPAQNSVISYDVTITGDTFNSVGLDFSATVSGVAIASVGETVTDLTTGSNYSLQVSSITSNTDSVSLAPASTTLHVVKSIDIAAFGGTATITLVDNTYGTTSGGATPPVPEPMSLALLPLALAGFGLRRKLAR